MTAEQMPSRVIDEERCSACAAPHHRISQLERVMNLNSSVLGSAQHQRRQLQFIAIGVWRISSVTRPFPALGGVCTKEATCSLSPSRKIIMDLLHFREILNEMKQICVLNVSTKLMLGMALRLAPASRVSPYLAHFSASPARSKKATFHQPVGRTRSELNA